MKPSKQNLQVLIVEDSENDAALLEIELQRAGYDPVCARVETPEGMAAALKERPVDVVIADYVMPHFNGLAALGLLKSQGLDLPFIVVSGHITDDTAVAAMKAGAHDYVMKDNLARLGPAVQRELREAEVRRERRQTEERLKAESAFRQAIENSVPSGIAVVDLEGKQTYVNPAFCQMVGWSEAELIGAVPPFRYWPAEETEIITQALAKVVEGNSPPAGIEARFRRRNGEELNVLLQVTPLKDVFGNVSGWVSSALDITERKRAEIRLAAEHAITRILANAPSLEEAAPGIVQVLLDSVDVEIASLWVVDAKHQSLIPSITNLRRLTPELKRFQEESRRHSFKKDEGLPGRVWGASRPLWVSDLNDETGFLRREPALRAGLRSAIAFPVHSGGELFGVVELLTVRRMENDHTLLNMVSAIGSEIGQFIHRRSAEEALRRAHDELEMRVQQRTAELKTANSRLQASITERKRLENELLEITEKERRRIGLDLHDDLGQKLSGIALMTKGLELRLSKKDKEDAQEAGKIHELVQQAMNHASDLAHDLATLDFKSSDLSAALEQLADHVRDLFKISCNYKVAGEVPPLDPGIIRQLYKIAQEAVTNAIKHGKAKKVMVELEAADGELTLSVQNNGLPFPDLQGKHTGMGLRIMNYRASLIGGVLEIGGLGKNGTLVTCTLPLDVRKPATA